MREPPTQPLFLVRHVILHDANLATSHTYWNSVAQPCRMTQLSPEFWGTLCGIELGGTSVFWTEVSGAYRMQTVTQGDAFTLVYVARGQVEWTWTAPNPQLALPGAELYWFTPGVDVNYTVVNPTGMTVKVGLPHVDWIRIKAMPYSQRQQLTGAVPPEDASDIIRLMTFLLEEIDRLDVHPHDIPAQIRLIRDALVERVKYAASRIIGDPRPLRQGDLETVVDCDQVLLEGTTWPGSVSELAAQVPWSERQIYRAFENVCDCTPNDYLRRAAMIAARSWLRYVVPSPPTLEQVATRFGYRSGRAFERDYTREFHDLPLSGN